MSLSLRNCEWCKRVFHSAGIKKCPDCLAKIEEDFELIKAVLENDPEIEINAVMERTGIDERTIVFLVEQGRLSTEKLRHSIKCHRCQSPADNYKMRLCTPCMRQLEQELLKTTKGKEKNGASPNKNPSKLSNPPIIGGIGAIHREFEEKR